MPCQAWVNEGHGVEHILSTFKSTEVVEYRLRLHTSDIPNAGEVELVRSREFSCFYGPA
jgi:hypothetical protein